MSREEGLTELYALVEVSTTDAVEKANLLSLCQSIISQNRQSSELLESIPILRSPSQSPLACLSLLLTAHDGPWPVLDLICRHTKLWKALPEELKHGSSELVENVLRQVKKSYRGLPDLLHTESDRPAILEPQSSRYLTHRALSKFIERFSLPIAANHPHAKPVIAIALPNGPLLGIVCLAVCAKYTAAPINATAGAEQFRADVLQANASIILAAEADVERLELRDNWVQDAGIDILIVNQQADMTFNTISLNSETNYSTSPAIANGPDDTALILSTSGTSGTKKIVPFTLHTMISGVAFVVESWGLTDKDACLNMMPLNHVGGLVRNLFAPVLSGGSTICCSAFDPNLFWDVVEEQGPTWYYASPSMHSAILSEASFRPEAMAKNQMRLVCNAAGGLLPSLAIQLRDTFDCTVLPSYGMTECMPISTPPLNYRLDRPGTSGVSTGPEMAVLGGSGEPLPPREVGYVCVRGAAVFLGYLTASGLDKSAFNKDGWFDTGDMGYLDEDGYVYITGRSKEVINRGGEIISPFEVEEAIMVSSKNPDSPIFGRVSEALIFSAPHEVLQEVVGAVLVTPPGKPRVDLRQLQKALGHSLHSVKWPVVVVYMDSVPKRNNKVLRIRLGERLSFSEVTDHALQSERHFEAICPPPDTPLSQKIEKISCAIDSKIVTDAIENLLPKSLDVHVAKNPHDGLLTAYVAPKDIGTEDPRVYGNVLAAHLPASLDGYLVPQHIHYIGETFPRKSGGAVDIDRLRTIISSSQREDTTLTSYEKKIRAIFAELLSCEAADITSDSDFFELGGDSMKAGRLLSILRKELNVRLPIDMLFQNGSVSSLGEIVEKSRPSSKDGPDVTIKPVLPGCSKTYSSTNVFLLCLQLVPIGILYPMKRALEYTILLYTLSMMLVHWGPDDIPGRLLCLVVAIGLARVVMRIIAPLVAIALKWIVIGKHKEGMYPMWGPYHTRWWFVQKALMVGGKGFFGDFNWSRVLYFRLLGAKIGKGVNLDKKAMLGEYDLVEIGDNVRLDPCICRPFAAERNTSMYLGRIKIGNNCSIGLKSIVAAGTVLPDNTCIGPNSSSFEAEDATEANRDLSSGLAPSAHPILSTLIGLPIKGCVVFISLLPWMAGLVGLVDKAPGQSDDMIRSVILWFASPMRVGFHFLARVLNHTAGPVMFVVSVIFIKFIMDSMFGRMQPGSVLKRSQLDRFRKQLVNDLLPSGDLSGITGLFGSHYEATSMVVRALGGKVGRNVYWPGSGPTIQDFDMVDIGNDVVFGSRSHIITSDGIGTGCVRINDGVMVADRVVIGPGATVGSNTVLGSGALLKRDKFYPDNTVWVGSKHGEAICLTRVSNVTSENADIEKSAALSITSSSKESLESEDASSSSPFGRAFYEGKANYYVLGMFSIFCYCLIIQICVSIYWNVPTISSMQFMGLAIERYPEVLGMTWYRPLMLYAIILAVNIGLLGTQALLAVSVVIAAKWALMGRRKPGSYDWDKSSYCQRWQIFLTIERLRRQCFGGHGVIGMLTGTHYTVMYFRAMGANIGKDCALFAGGRPSLLFTEPDLLTLGDRVAIDDASLVAHINSRGNFSLNPLCVGERSVLRSGSRLLSGAQMRADSCLLEHTLIMAGDIVDQETTYQGWPAEIYDGERVKLSVKDELPLSRISST